MRSERGGGADLKNVLMYINDKEKKAFTSAVLEMLTKERLATTK